MSNLQDKLKESRDRLRLIADSVPALIAYVDWNQRYVFCNAAYHEWFGISVKKIQGLQVKDIFDEQTYRFMQPYIEKVLAGERVEYEIEHTHRTKGRRINSTTLTPHFNEEQEVVGYCVLSTDVTSIREAEDIANEHSRELNLAMEKLERINLELEQFAAACSHDLQEPLRMIKGYADLLLKRYDSLFDDKARTYFEFILEGTERMEALIRGLLDYARMEQPENLSGTISMNAVLEKAIKNLNRRIAETETSVSADSLPDVRGHGMQLVRLLQNLLSNAIKFAGGDPPLIQITANQSDNETWVFSVRDNGIGIDAKHGDKIFDLFKRLHSHSAYPGTGIGLAECKKIVENHGGRIWYESSGGKGTTFYFTLPAAKPSGELPSHPSSLRLLPSC